MAAGTVLVTGGSGRGIGRAITERLLDDGYHVVNFDINTPEQLRERESHYKVDMMDRKATAEALAKATASHKITRLVNCLGIVRPHSIEEQTQEEFDQVYEINLRCAFQCTKAVIPTMAAARFGRIVTISTRAALGKELRTAYSATKAGLHGMSKTWALELGDRNITVNVVAPGPIETEMFRDVNPPDSPRTRKIIESIPLKRMGQPADIAHSTAFFLDERTGYVTGQVLYVCGGITVGLVS